MPTDATVRPCFSFESDAISYCCLLMLPALHLYNRRIQILFGKSIGLSMIIGPAATALFTRWMLPLLVYVLACSAVSAQQPCRLDCDTVNVPFQIREYITSASSTCHVKVIVGVRACGGAWEIEIRAIQLLGVCQGADLVAVRRQATAEAIRLNTFGLPTNNVVWRVSAPSCWRYAAPGMLLPCNAACCVSTLKVETKVGCDKWSITAEGRTTVRPTCPLSIGSSGQSSGDASVDGSCFFSCEPVVLTK